MQNVQQLLQRLIAAGVDLVIVGDFAGAAYGASRLTRVLEICLPSDRHALERLLDALRDLRPVFRPPPEGRPLPTDVEKLVGFRNLYLHTDLGDLDCLSYVEGLGDYPVLRERSRVIKVWDHEVRVLDLEALVQAKRALGRPRDLDALPELEALLELSRES